MPLKGVRYRVVNRPGQDKLRLAFRGQDVVEVKNLRTGDTHTAKEFQQDRARKGRKR